MFLRCSFWIRVNINLERCWCIVFPIKVKMFFSTTKARVVVVCIYLLMFAFLVPGAACLQFQPTFNPTKNVTVFYVTITKSAACTIDISNMINVTARVVLFILDVIFTIIMIQKLQIKSKWRSESSAGKWESGPTLSHQNAGVYFLHVHRQLCSRHRLHRLPGLHRSTVRCKPQFVLADVGDCFAAARSTFWSSTPWAAGTQWLLMPFSQGWSDQFKQTLLLTLRGTF